MKQQKKAEKEQEDKKELWPQLKTINKEFKNINDNLKKTICQKQY